MAVNFPGPYTVRIFYTVDVAGNGVLVHRQELNVRIQGTPEPGTAFGDIDVLRRDDTDWPLDGEIDDWVALLADVYNSANTEFTHAELWKYDPLSFDANFVSTYPLAVVGTSGSGNAQAGQVIYTFRTQEGGIMKITLMEAAVAAGNPLGYSSISAAQQAIVDAVQYGSSPWLARDTSYPFAFIRQFGGQNEATFKKRFRD